MTSFQSVETTTTARLLQQIREPPFSAQPETPFLFTQKNSKFGQKTRINQLFYFTLMNAFMVDPSGSLRGRSYFEINHRLGPNK